MNTLIVVDMQNDFITGSLGSIVAETIVSRVVEKAKQPWDQIIFTKDTHYDNYLDTFEGKNLPVKHCIYGTDGWEICDALKEIADRSIVIQKYTFGYLNWDDILNRSTKFLSILRENEDIIEICGLCTDICVVNNALILRAIYPGMRIVVDPLCCAGTTPEKHEAALEVMRSCQIEMI